MSPAASGTEKDMTFPLSRLMSTATATYGVYALANPRHLGDAVDPKHADDYDLLATTYGARDLAISSVGLLGRVARRRSPPRWRSGSPVTSRTG